MFKVGDNVEIVATDTWPLYGLKHLIGAKGVVIEIKEWNVVFPGMPSGRKILFKVEVGFWCAEENLKLISSVETTTADYPHVCPFCKGPAYIGFFNHVDCKSNCQKG